MNIDGDSGAFVDDGGEYIEQLSIQTRLGTLYGRQLMRPDYGLDVSPLVDRPSLLVSAALSRNVSVALRGFDLNLAVDRKADGTTVVTVGR